MAHKGEINLPTFFHASELDPPQLAGAVATAYNKVRVYYNQEMCKTDPGGANDSLNPANYAFTGGLTAVSVALVTPGPTVVEVTVDKEMLQGGAYEVEVSNVQICTRPSLIPCSTQPASMASALHLRFRRQPRRTSLRCVWCSTRI